MRCRDIQKELPDYVRGKVAGDSTEVIAGHLASCAGCRSELQEMKAVFSTIDQHPSWNPDNRYWASILPRVHDRLQQRSHQLIPEWILRYLAPAIAAIALVLLIVKIPISPTDMSATTNRPTIDQIPADELTEYIDGQSIAHFVELSASQAKYTDDDLAVLSSILESEGSQITQTYAGQEYLLESLTDQEAEQIVPILERQRTANFN